MRGGLTSFFDPRIPECWPDFAWMQAAQPRSQGLRYYCSYVAAIIANEGPGNEVGRLMCSRSINAFDYKKFQSCVLNLTALEMESPACMSHWLVHARLFRHWVALFNAVIFLGSTGISKNPLSLLWCIARVCNTFLLEDPAKVWSNRYFVKE